MNLRLIALISYLFCTAAYAHLRVQVTPAQLQPGDVATLVLDEDHSISGDPDLSPLQKDFIVQGQSRGTTLQIINGNVSEQTEVQVSLLPRHAGNLMIPALHWGQDSSQALSIQVPTAATAPVAPSTNAAVPSAATGQDNAPHIFIQESLQHPDVYLQTPELLSVAVFTDQPLYQASLDLEGNADVMIQPWGKDSRSEQVVHGQNYQVITREYLVVPQRHGTLQLPAATLDAQVQDNSLSSLFGPGAFGASFGLMHPIHLTSSPASMHVLPWPTDARGTPLLPSDGLSIHMTLAPASAHIDVGQPLMIHIHEEGLNVTGEDLPDPTQHWTVPQGIRIFPDPAHLTMKRENNIWIGVRDQDIAMVADQPGHVLIPEARNTWWDTTTHVPAVSSIPPMSLQINGAARLPVASTAISPATLQPTNQHEHDHAARWRLLSLLLTLGWALSLLGWFLTWRHLSKNPQPMLPSNLQIKPTHPRDAWQRLVRALASNDPQQVHQQLRDWAQTQWPEPASSGMLGIPEALLNPILRKHLDALDRACFSPDANWNSENLSQALQTLKQNVQKKPADKKNQRRLNDLYED